MGATIEDTAGTIQGLPAREEGGMKQLKICVENAVARLSL